MPLDAISTQIVWNRIVSIVDEAATGLIRTAYTPAVKDYHDFCCAVFDADANMLAHSTVTTAGFLGIVPEVMRNFVASFPGTLLAPGDIVITNDPWLASGHLIDISIAAPIWKKDRLVGYALCIVHHLDMGGRMATLESKSIFEEGLKIPVLKLASNDSLNSDILAFIKANLRVPDKVIGDIRAQIASTHICSRGILEFLNEFGFESLEEVSAAIIQRTDESFRLKLAALPQGQFRNTVRLPPIPGCEERVEIKVCVTIEDEHVLVDFTGTSGEVPAAVNCTLNMTRSYASYPIKLALDPSVPNNEGSLRRIKVVAPAGSILNCRPPAATWGRTMISHCLPEIIFGALASAIPAAVLGSCGGTPANEMYVHGIDRAGRTFMTISQHSGGYGGSASSDGISCLPFPNNTSNTPIEVTETDATVLYLRKEFLEDSAGPGHHRGGFGQTVEFEILAPGGTKPTVECSVRVTGRHEAGDFPVSGQMGGGVGRGGGLWINGAPVDHGTHRILRAGDVVRFVLGGGGGYGNPLERPLEDVVRDVRARLVSLAGAVDDYGVVIESEHLRVDAARTAMRRAQLSNRGAK